MGQSRALQLVSTPANANATEARTYMTHTLRTLPTQDLFTRHGTLTAIAIARNEQACDAYRLATYYTRLGDQTEAQAWRETAVHHQTMGTLAGTYAERTYKALTVRWAAERADERNARSM